MVSKLKKVFILFWFLLTGIFLYSEDILLNKTIELEDIVTQNWSSIIKSDGSNHIKIEVEIFFEQEENSVSIISYRNLKSVKNSFHYKIVDNYIKLYDMINNDLIYYIYIDNNKVKMKFQKTLDFVFDDLIPYNID